MPRTVSSLTPQTGLSARTERHLLQAAVALAGFVPVLSGLAGALLGTSMTGEGSAGIAIDSHTRFLSGLLLGIGLAFWEAIPQIERRGERIRLLTALVVLGGLMRLVGILFVALPGAPMLAGLAMELAVAPAICLWQAGSRDAAACSAEVSLEARESANYKRDRCAARA